MKKGCAEGNVYDHTDCCRDEGICYGNQNSEGACEIAEELLQCKISSGKMQLSDRYVLTAAFFNGMYHGRNISTVSAELSTVS